MSNTSFHGAFILRDQGYGILSGTYFNTGDPKPYPETAILTGVQNDEEDKINNPGGYDYKIMGRYDGVYETIWIERTEHVKMTLQITSTAGSYKLTWIDMTNTKRYQGLGIIENGCLVGCYWLF